MEFQMFDIVQQTLPADTFNYMVAGYAVIFGAMLLYVVSLIIRRRNLEQDMNVILELEQAEGNPGGASSQEYQADTRVEGRDSKGQPVMK
jgi:hypothetical protein